MRSLSDGCHLKAEILNSCMEEQTSSGVWRPRQEQTLVLNALERDRHARWPRHQHRPRPSDHHRLAVASISPHGRARRQGTFHPGPPPAELSLPRRQTACSSLMPGHSGPAAHTKRSSALPPPGDYRVCVAASNSRGWVQTIPVGATLSMSAGSAAQVLSPGEPDRLHRGLCGASFNATMLSEVRRRGSGSPSANAGSGVASVSRARARRPQRQRTVDL